MKYGLGSDGFWRLRIGIGRPVHGDVRLFVTSPFTKDEKIRLDALFSRIPPLLAEPMKEGSVRI